MNMHKHIRLTPHDRQLPYEYLVGNNAPHRDGGFTAARLSGLPSGG